MVDAESKIAVIEEMFREFARRDDTRTFQVLDEEVVFDTRAYPGPDTLRAVYHGHDGIRAYWRQWLDAWESVDVVDGPHHEIYGGTVISWWRQRNRGKSSGIEVEMDTAVSWTFQGDRILHAAVYATAGDARKAVGVPE